MNNQKLLSIINKANATWRPVMCWAFTICVILTVVVYPILHMIFSIWGINVVFPQEITNHMFALVTGTSILFGLRIAEKKMGVTNVH